MASRIVGSVLCALAAACGTAAPVGAQQFTGGVRGAVRDANGVIPGVDGHAHQRGDEHLA